VREVENNEIVIKEWKENVNDKINKKRKQKYLHYYKSCGEGESWKWNLMMRMGI